jgi:hypothetical protein
MNFTKTDTLAPIMSNRRPEAEAREVFVRSHLAKLKTQQKHSLDLDWSRRAG